MEAALFTLDVFFLLLLIRVVLRSDRMADKAQRSLGLFSYLEKKSDEVEKGLGHRKAARDA